MRSSRIFAALAAAFTVSACEQAFMTEPAPESVSAPIAVSVATESAGGAPEAFDKADTTWIEVRNADGVRLERKIGVRANGQSIPILLMVPLLSTSENFTLNVELRRGAAPLFRGSISVALRIGPITRQVAVTLTPVASGLALPDTLPTLTAYGDSVLTRGATIFATLDTVAANQTVQWTSLDPSIVAVTGGVPVARADGLARLIGTVSGFTDTTAVRVFAIVTRVVPQPDTTAGPIVLGNTRQYTARLFDRRNNLIVNRPVSWLSANPAVLGVNNTTGLATGLQVGSSLLTATSGGVSGSVLVRVVGLPPTVTTDSARSITPTGATIHFSVNPNRQASDAWLVYGTDSTLVNATATALEPLPAGATPVKLATVLFGLSPRTTYYVRAFGRNQSGTGIGNLLEFTTPDVPLSQPAVITGPVTALSDTSVTFNGTAIPGPQPLAVWFEWSPDSTFNFKFDTPEQNFLAGSGAHAFNTRLSMFFPPGITLYYRAAGRNASGLLFGARQSFVTPGDCSSASNQVNSVIVPCSAARTGVRKTGTLQR